MAVYLQDEITSAGDGTNKAQGDQRARRRV
jgi:hypothetical protein